MIRMEFVEYSNYKLTATENLLSNVNLTLPSTNTGDQSGFVPATVFAKTLNDLVRGSLKRLKNGMMVMQAKLSKKLNNLQNQEMMVLKQKKCMINLRDY